MSGNNFNEFVSAVNLLGDNYDVNNNNVVVIDTQNNRIGIGTQDPAYDLDISKSDLGGNKIKIKNVIIDGNNQKIDISNTKYIDFSNSNKIVTNYSGLEYKLTGSTDKFTLYNDISINGDLSLVNLYITNDISCLDICANNLYITNDISCLDICANNLYINNDISCLDICANNLYINNDISCLDICANNLYINNDISINGDISCNDICSNDISCNILYATTKIFIGTQELTASSSSGLIMGVPIPSDDRLKHNEKNLKNTLNTIKSLNPIVYDKTTTFKNIDYTGEITEPYIKEIGLIAQDVEKINDLSFSVIKGSETEPYKLNYNNIFNYCIAGLKESIITNETSYNIINSKLNNIEFNMNNIIKVNEIQSLNDIFEIINNQNKMIENLSKEIDILRLKINNL